MGRSQDLKGWERSRRAEIMTDMFAIGFSGLVGVSVGYSMVEAGPTRWTFLVTAVFGLYLAVLLVCWLRVECAYLERRLIEIEALIGNETPTYYTSGDMVSFDKNPLYARLEAIEASIERLHERA